MQLPIDGSSPSIADLLHYLPAYRVLICKPCRYAIQPSAIGRHLKEIHHIRSKARRPFIEYSHSLALDEPGEVTYPTQDDFPVLHLPVERGWRCEAQGCEYLCVSDKRMEMHWSAVHCCKGLPSRDWSAVPLQTFFRGNMLQYFAGPRIQASHPVASSDHLPQAITKPVCGEATPKTTLIERYRLQGIDVEALDQYFASTYNTFLINESPSRVQQIWLEIAPALAVDHHFVLGGMLASGCLHLAHIKPHRRVEFTDRSMAHLDSALPAFRHSLDHPSRENCDAIIAFAYLLLVVTIASDAGSPSTNPLLFVRATDLGEQHLLLSQWLHFLRVGCPMLSSVWSYIEEGPMRSLVVDLKSEAVPEADVRPRFKRLSTFIPHDGSWLEHEVDVYKEAARALAESLAQIEMSRMADAAGQARTFVVFACWPIKMHDDALALLSRRHPGMLILLAHYCICLKQLDSYWYFTDRAVNLMSLIQGILHPRWHPFIEEPRAIVLETAERDHSMRFWV